MELMFWWLLPILLLAAILTGVLAWKLDRGESAMRVAGTLANTQRLRGLPAYRRAVKRSWRMGMVSLIVLALAFGGAAMSASRWVYTDVETPEAYNRDIVLCLDVSGSMVEYDAEVIDRYLEMLPGFDGERMSLVLWNSSAVPVFPLTDDYSFVEEQLTDIREAMLDGDILEYGKGTLNRPGASLVGDGLASCLLQFDNVKNRGQTAVPTSTPGTGPDVSAPPVTVPGTERRSRSVILATDNVVNGSPTVSFSQATELAAEYDIKIYGLDANTFSDAFQQEYEGLMKRHAFEYFRLDDGKSVDAIVDAITSEQASRWQGAPQVLIIDTPRIWLTIGLIGAAGVLITMWRTRS